MLLSRDAYIYPRNHPERAELIEGALGEESRFGAAYGYYAHAVGLRARGRDQWRDRLAELLLAESLPLEPAHLTSVRAGLAGLA